MDICLVVCSVWSVQYCLVRCMWPDWINCRSKMNLKVHVKQGRALEWYAASEPCLTGFIRTLLLVCWVVKLTFPITEKKNSISAFSPVWFSKCWTRWKDSSAQSNSAAQTLGRFIHHRRLELHISCRSWSADQKYRDRGRRWYYTSSR